MPGRFCPPFILCDYSGSCAHPLPSHWAALSPFTKLRPERAVLSHWNIQRERVLQAVVGASGVLAASGFLPVL